MEGFSGRDSGKLPLVNPNISAVDRQRIATEELRRGQQCTDRLRGLLLERFAPGDVWCEQAVQLAGEVMRMLGAADTLCRREVPAACIGPRQHGGARKRSDTSSKAPKSGRPSKEERKRAWKHMQKTAGGSQCQSDQILNFAIYANERTQNPVEVAEQGSLPKLVSGDSGKAVAVAMAPEIRWDSAIQANPDIQASTTPDMVDEWNWLSDHVSSLEPEANPMQLGDLSFSDGETEMDFGLPPLSPCLDYGLFADMFADFDLVFDTPQ